MGDKEGPAPLLAGGLVGTFNVGDVGLKLVVIELPASIVGCNCGNT